MRCAIDRLGKRLANLLVIEGGLIDVEAHVENVQGVAGD